MNRTGNSNHGTADGKNGSNERQYNVVKRQYGQKDNDAGGDCEKRIIYIVVFTAILLLVCLLAFLYKKKRVGIKDTGNADKNVTEEIVTTKDLWLKSLEDNNSIELSRLSHENRHMAEGTDYEAFDNKLCAWWFKRNDNHEKSDCQKDFDILAYNAHFTVPVAEKRIFITFDCGYENGFTADILDVLKQENVPAAFFVTQTFIRDNVELVKRMKEEGHLVCNHTVTHPSMPSKSIAEQKEEILKCENYMREATGYDMDLFFRPPRGEYSERTLQLAKDLGYTTIFWSMAYLDYDVDNQPSAEHVVEHFSRYHHPGAIPLIHNVSKANHDAIERVIELLKREGYSFGNLYELSDAPCQ